MKIQYSVLVLATLALSLIACGEELTEIHPTMPPNSDLEWWINAKIPADALSDHIEVKKEGNETVILGKKYTRDDSDKIEYTFEGNDNIVRGIYITDRQVKICGASLADGTNLVNKLEECGYSFESTGKKGEVYNEVPPECATSLSYKICTNSRSYISIDHHEGK